MADSAPEKPRSGNHINQIFAAVAISFGPLSVGLGKGYTSPALESLQDHRSSGRGWKQSINSTLPSLPGHPGSGPGRPLSFQGSSPEDRGHWEQNPPPMGSAPFIDVTITEQQGSWVAGLSLLGALFGGACSALLMRHGRRRAILVAAGPLALSWVVAMFASCVEMIYASAFLVGFFSAMIQLASQVYLSEISHPAVRASLCSGAKVFQQAGLLAAYGMGAVFDWRQLAMVCAGAPLMLLITAQYVPETPSHLMYTGQEARAEKALRWLRGGCHSSSGADLPIEDDDDVLEELAVIRINVREIRERRQQQQQQQQEHASSRSRSSWMTGCFRHKMQSKLLRPLFITCGLMLFLRFSGVAAFNFYAVTIFREAFGGGFDPHLAAVVTGSVQLAASFSSGVLCDYFGRLPLLLASSLLMTLALAGFGAFSYMGIHQASLDWIPLLCVVTFVSAFSVGISPIAWLLVGEMFPLEFRSLGPSMTTVFSYICAFVGVKTFVDLREAFGMHGTFWVYASISLLGLVFVLFFVPETRGKNLDEMKPNGSSLDQEDT